MQSTIYRKWLIVIIIVTTSKTTSTSSQTEHGIDACEFPEFMQTKTTTRDWRRVVLAQNTDSTGSITVDRMLLRSIGATGIAEHRYRYVQTCLKIIKVDDAELYLVSHDTDVDLRTASDDPETPDDISGSGGGTGGGDIGRARRRYACVQFIRRGPDVVQTRSTSLTKSLDERSCDFRSLGDPDPSLFVDVAVLTQPPLPSQFRQPACSLRGGFRLRISGGGRQRRSSCSDAATADSRLESNCDDEDDDSVLFNFGSVECVPEGLYMYAVQRVVCMATWTSGTNTFSVLRHDRLTYAWLLRHPTEYDASFVAHLFVDLYADTAASIAPPSSSNFLLELVRDRPVPITSLCTDESDTCVTDEVELARSLACRSSDGARKLMCARTCGLCNATRPAVCQFPPEMVGVWIDGTGANQPVSDNTLTVLTDRKSFIVRSTSVTDEQRYYCIRFRSSDDTTASNSPRNRTGKISHVSDEFLVATSPTNGCRRRYACARFTLRSSSIMYFRFSEARTWPLTSTPSSPIDCRWFNYDVTRRGTSRSESHETPIRLLFARERFRDLATSQAAVCRLPSDDLSNYSVSFVQNGSATVSDCVGSLLLRPPGPAVDTNANVLLTLAECTRTKRAASATVSFACLDSMRLASGDFVLVSTVVSTMPTFTNSTPSQMSSSKSFSPSTNSSNFQHAAHFNVSSFAFSKTSVPPLFIGSSSLSSTFLPSTSASANFADFSLPQKAVPSQSVPLLTSYPEIRRDSSSFSSAFVSSSFAFRRGLVYCWLFPHASYVSQFYVVSASRCAKLFVVNGDQRHRQSAHDAPTKTQGEDTDYIRRQIFSSASATGAIFSKTRGRSPRLEPPPGGQGDVEDNRPHTSSSAAVESSDIMPLKQLPVSRAEQRSIVLNDQRAVMSDEESESEQIDEIVWDDVDDQTVRTPRRVSSVFSEASCAVFSSKVDVRTVVVAVILVSRLYLK